MLSSYLLLKGISVGLEDVSELVRDVTVEIKHFNVEFFIQYTRISFMPRTLF